jgi:hypothetical protein
LREGVSKGRVGKGEVRVMRGVFGSRELANAVDDGFLHEFDGGGVGVGVVVLCFEKVGKGVVDGDVDDVRVER